MKIVGTGSGFILNPGTCLQKWHFAGILNYLCMDNSVSWVYRSMGH
jgi:hypothetical protein